MRAAARAALAAPAEGVVAVTGADAAAVEAALAGLGEGRLRTVRADDWVEGVAASLRAGLRALPDDARGAVVFLGDMPRVDGASAGRLAAAIEAGAAAAEFRHRGGPAHPVALSAALFPLLLAQRGDRGARVLLDGRADVARIDTDDPGAAFDVDRPADLAAGP